LRRLNRRKAAIILLTILGAIGAFIAGSLVAEIQYRQQTQISNYGLIVSDSVTVTVIRAPRFIAVEVSPLAFPVVGESWKIFVYAQNVSSDLGFYTPQPNATVLVTVNDGNKIKTYNLPADEKGQTEFQYLADYTDVAFRASYAGNESETVVISTHFAPSDSVDTLMIVSGFMSPLTGIGSGLSFRNKKVKMVLSTLITGVFVVFIFIMIFSTYAKLFLGTIWGYPENIGLVSLDLLKYATIIGVVLFSILSVLAFAFQKRDSAQKSNFQ
jgi:uncharacterized membrane protein YeaQ/YmgE (transglycosylase-associated protein family)